ncbi:TRAP transporter large permease [Bacteriovorax stolpii]|uniref:C4-dicarboxylate ABC transporter n=1 Tax=Bacteriovorax stolpii TaxID=960 RepID=A0A2K9NP10_BACTC|nr:TRAP transporter large permease subunit [Bacteriovorax stolpii]AUN97259.1 C4-dicarboxylate ABC transporter [Bacteriovorax stolpii]QDK42803.1 TRAP transporter large permease [Bacteriovorax stolpii]TDP52429.1 tripartite ATP-independent transporter DctM subunit [Bacteriovorax stolpii]
MTGTVAALGIVFLAILGTPLFIIMSLAALVAFTFSGVEVSAVAQEFYRISSAPTLMTIPLFTFAGYLMAESKSPQRLLKLAETGLGWLPGGISIVALVVCAFFTAFTGASGVTIIALGGLIYPILMRDGYSEKYTLGMITASGSLGLLFPPSLPIILYGMVAKVDIDKLFKAGIVPGIVIMVVLSFWAVYNSPKHTGEKTNKFILKDFVAALKEAWLEALLPVAVLVGIYGGIVTVTEAAAFTALYIFIVEVFIYKDLDLFKDIPRVIVDSMSLVGGILLILCCALGFTNFLVDEEVPLKIFALMKEFLHDKYSFLLFLNIFLLIVGCLMDIFSAIIVVVPLIIPIANDFGVDPIHLAIIFLANLEIGYLTPPVGINLFIGSFRFNKPITTLYRASVPFLVLLIIALIIITYVPSLSLFWFK